MAVILVCVLLVLAGLVAAVRWGDLTLRPPWLAEDGTGPPDQLPAVQDGTGPPDQPPAAEDGTGPPDQLPVGLVVRRYLWYLTVAVASGVGAGILAAGAGGRLVMRLLAVTAGPDAQGRITEAEQVVGRITADGTLGFVVFTGLFFGAVTGVLYLLVRRWLPAGRAAGLAYGAVLLVVAGTRLEPLRRGNPDFDLVGPGWVSVVAFTALVVFHGALVAALAGRISRALPLLDARPRAIAAHAPLLLLLAFAPVVLVLITAGVVAVVASRVPTVLAAWQDRRAVLFGRVALALAVVLAVPGFASDLVDILGRP